MSKTAYVAFGSNIGDAVENIRSAVRAFYGVPGISVEKVSPCFLSRPWGYEKQDNFVNACARLSTRLSPELLLGVCLGIEAAMGRVREIKNGPRVIDIDLIMYENETRSTKELTLPHPRFAGRDFVLLPLIEVSLERDRAFFQTALEKIEKKDRYIEKKLLSSDNI